MDHGVVRFGEGKHHAVKFRTVLERLGKLEAEIVAVRVAKKVELPVLVDEFGKILENSLGNENLTMPIVKRLADRMGELAYLSKFGTRLLNSSGIDERMGIGVWLKHGESVYAAICGMAVAAGLERIDAAVFNGLLHHTLHIGDVYRRRMHYGPRNLRLCRRNRYSGHSRTERKYRIFHSS